MTCARVDGCAANTVPSYQTQGSALPVDCRPRSSPPFYPTIIPDIN